MRTDKKCDLCGSTYDGIPTLTPVRGTPTTPIMTDSIRIEHVWPGHQDDRGRFIPGYEFQRYNICPICYQRIVGFIEQLKKGDYR